MERLVRRRKETPEWGFGTWRVVANDVDAVLAHRCDWQGSTVLAVHNFGPEPCHVRLTLDDIDGAVALDDLIDRERHPLDGTTVELDLGRYGHRWLRVARHGQRVVP
jgi:hypothetical protein